MSDSARGRGRESEHDAPHVVCPLCRSSDTQAYETIATIRRVATGRYLIRRCRAHRVEFADPESGTTVAAAEQSALDSLYGALDDSRPKRYRDFMDRVEEVGRPPGIIHDVGCGNGQLLVEARHRGWTVQGNDLVDTVGPVLESRGIPYFAGALADLDLPPGTCEVVSSFCVLPHHVADPVPDLKAVVSLLRPSGWLVAELPDDGLYRRLARWVYHLSGGRVEAPLANIYSPRGHIFGYSRRNLELLLRACGFTTIFFRPYRQPARLSTARFSQRSRRYRAAAFAATWALAGLSRVLRMPNHMVVYAQKPGDDAGPAKTG